MPVSALLAGVAIGRPVANALLALAVLGTMLLAVVGRRLLWVRTARRRTPSSGCERAVEPIDGGRTSQRQARR